MTSCRKTVKKCNVAVLGIGGKVKCNVKGTVSWTVKDDQGHAHNIVIPDTPLCESLPHRLLSPPHWAQETESRSRSPLLGLSRPSCSTNADATTLLWGRGRFTKTVPLDAEKNVAVMTTKPGSSRYTAFAASVESLEPTICCFVATGAPTSYSQPTQVTDGEETDTTDKDTETIASKSTEEEDEKPDVVDFEEQPNVGASRSKRISHSRMARKSSTAYT
jgi:hypothetical protein